MVIRKGEDLLTDFDTWGIVELRRLKLIWSSWGQQASLPEQYELIPSTPDWGVRRVKVRDPARLRLFFLSLLWRAAASQRWEFAEITMPAEHLEQLRLMLLNKNAVPLNFYPAMLTQLSTRGEVHNMTPIAAIKQLPQDDGSTIPLPTFRFYMDGLVIHFNRQDTDDGVTEQLGPLIAGNSDELAFSTISYEKSFQRENLNMVVAETMSWPRRPK